MYIKGVKHLTNDSFVYSFDLKESLFMEGGQGISEIKHISLDPDISIQSFNDYYSIRGVILLSGEYIQESLKEEADSLSTLNDFDFKRYIENTVPLDEDLAQFTHRFPVEISVPSYRVKDMNDVAVQIASFDYELPSADKLIIDATVQIQGVKGETPVYEETKRERMNEDNVDVALHEESDADVFSFEVIHTDHDDMKQREKEITTDQSNQLSNEEVKNGKMNDQRDTTNRLPTLPKLREESRVEETVQSKEDDRKEEERLLFKKKAQSLEEFFAKEKEQTKSSTAETNSEKIINESEGTEEEPMMSEVESEQTEEKDQLEEDEREGDKELEEVSQLHFLSEMIRNEEETYTQMRLCIVQKEDTLESIAARYKTTSLHILKKNRLEDDTVSEGQLLYIPIKKKK